MARLTTLLFAMWLDVTVSTVVHLEKRVYGGKECGPDERLYHVLLNITDIKGKQYFCGGSLISDRWILTAAHCVEPDENVIAYIGVHAGTLQKMEITKNPKIFKEAFMFFFNVKKHDLMLLKLPDPVVGIDHVKLPNCTDRPNIGAVVQVAGHAATKVGPKKELQKGFSKTLQCADMNITDCQEFIDMFHVRLHEQWICTSRADVDTCKGDSGGGLVYKKRIYGVHVMGHPTHACGSPTVFMDLCHQPYLDWIKDTIKKPKSKCCFSCFC